MAHEFESGAFGSNKAAWHGLGEVVEGLMTASEALAKGKLDWTVSKMPLFTTVGDEQIAIPDHVATVRSTDNAVLGVVGKKYEVMNNVDAFDFFDAVIQSGDAKYDSVGSLRGGKKVFLSAKLPGTIKVTNEPGDEIEKYLLLSTSHDASSQLRMLFTPVRVVCANTLAAALDGKNKDGIQIRHTKNMAKKVEVARNTLGIANKYYDALGPVLQAFAGTKMSDADMKAFVEALMPAGEDKEVSPRLANTRAKVFELFSGGVGQTGAVRGTAWAAYNAVTEYADHHQSTRVTGGNSESDLRGDSVLFGTSLRLKQNAFALLSQTVGA